MGSCSFWSFDFRVWKPGNPRKMSQKLLAHRISTKSHQHRLWPDQTRKIEDTVNVMIHMTTAMAEERREGKKLSQLAEERCQEEKAERKVEKEGKK